MNTNAHFISTMISIIKGEEVCSLFVNPDACYCILQVYIKELIERLSMTFTADGKRQRLSLIFYSFLVILKQITQK